MEMLRTMHASYRAILQKLFSQEIVDSIRSADAEDKMDLVLRERNSLLLEVEELQRSVSSYSAQTRAICLCDYVTTIHGMQSAVHLNAVQ